MESPTTNGGEAWVDEALTPFAFFVNALAPVSAMAVPGSEHIEGVWIERMELTLPFEMDVLVDAAGKVRLAGGPPTQYTETTIMPVFHTMRLSVTGALDRAE